MKPMLARSVDLHVTEQFLSDDRWVAQQKLDGDRILIRIADGRAIALNREGKPRTNPVPRKVLDQFQPFTDLPGVWCFDGELMTDGTLWLFDLPEASGRVTANDPYEFRYAVLERFVAAGQWPSAPCVRLLPVARTAETKRKLFAELNERGAEGLVFRHLDGLYRQGKRSDMMRKAKFTNTADVIVHEVRAQGRNNCTFRLFDHGALVAAGSCSLEARPDVNPGDVIEVRYLYASNEGLLYQPVMLRIRDDKSPGECTVDQLHYTDRTVLDLEDAQ